MTDNLLRQAQLLEIEILREFKHICEEEGLKYFLLGGTALGAVRHNGFIPWDDDIDVGMMRPDYDKFITIANKYLQGNVRLYHYTTKPEYCDYTAKMVNTRAFFVTKKIDGESKENIWIDVFPLDGSPNNSFLRKIHYRLLDIWRGLLAIHYLDQIQVNENRSAFKNLIIRISRQLSLGKSINPVNAAKKIDYEFRKYDTITSDFIGNYMSPYHEKDMFNREFFGDGTEVLFEGEYYNAPGNIDGYLTHLYGDYMKLPPEEKRIPKHHLIEIII